MHRNTEYTPHFHLGEHLVRPDLNRIRVGPDEVQVEPRVMQVLLRLAEQPGRVCSRADLLDEVWGDSIVGEENLTRAVSELRRVFGDEARRPRYIETIRNHGYRLIAEVRPAAGEPAGPETDDQTGSPPPPTGLPEPSVTAGPAESASRRWRTFLWPAAALLVVLVLVAVIGPLLSTRLRAPAELTVATETATFSAVDARPLTTFPGREQQPALAPDGSRVAFVWNDPEGDGPDLYLKQRDSEATRRLTATPGWEAWPCWSPDGNEVAFVQQADSLSALCTVPAAGGAATVRHRISSWVEGLDWSSDGLTLVFSARERSDGPHLLHRLTLADGAVERIPVERLAAAGDFQPRLSPDGSVLAWLGTELNGTTGVFLAPATGGRARMLTEGMAGLRGLAWTPDGGAIVYAAAPAGAYTLWRLPVAGAAESGPTAAEWIPTPGDLAWNPAIARETGDLVFEQVRVDQDVWRIRVLDSDPWRLETEPFLRSTRWDYDADYSPDGRQVVFVSGRAGRPDLWLADADGENLRRLTRLESAAVGNPRWAPDGLRVACNVVRGGMSAVAVVPIAAGEPETLTPAGQSEVFSDWTRDGAGLLVGSDRGDGWQVYRLDPLDRSRRRLTEAGGVTAMESPDGQELYFTRPDQAGIWKRSPAGEENGAERVITRVGYRDRNHWRVLDGRIAWVLRTASNAFLMFLDLETGQSDILTELPGLAESGLGISPDGASILYTRTRSGDGDLLLAPGLFARP